ncbi:hypothetical protein BDR07DRAFT_1474313 [Suillus spraguei]|nr:hypothetical protein BDR07DRAFT_1474313 [Suillus spraguei]
MTKQITLYTAKVCPYAQRTEIALAEAGASFKRYEIDLTNKPEWYAPKVKPCQQGAGYCLWCPDVAPENPSPESTKLAESLILVEFIGDLYPSSNILPTDPCAACEGPFLHRDRLHQIQPQFHEVCIRQLGRYTHRSPERVDAIQDILPDGAKYAVGDQFTIATLHLYLLGKIELVDEERKNFLKGLEDPKYTKFNGYVQRLLARESFKSTFHEDVVEGVFTKKVRLS